MWVCVYELERVTMTKNIQTYLKIWKLFLLRWWEQYCKVTLVSSHLNLALSSLFADVLLFQIWFCVNHHGALNLQLQGNIWIHFRHESNFINKFKLIFKSMIFTNGDLSKFCTSLLTSFENELTTKVSHWMWIRNCFKTYDFWGYNW